MFGWFKKLRRGPGVTGEQDMLDFMQSLPGFDNETMIAAMTSVEEAIFPVWRHPDRQP